MIKPSGDVLANGTDIDFGKVAVASPARNEFRIQGLDEEGKLFGHELLVKK